MSMSLLSSDQEDGFIVLDKQLGPTSHQITAWARDCLGLDRLGHGGTLDPEASGVLLLLLGKAMKLTRVVLSHSKTYVAVLRFAGDPSSQLDAVVGRLNGRIYNTPPRVSAVRVQVRTRMISSMRVIESDGRMALLEISAESGTYVRTIARDLGLMLGMRCDLVELRRTRSGQWSDRSAVTLADIADAVSAAKAGDSRGLGRIIHPLDRLLDAMPAAVLRPTAAATVACGAPLMRPGLLASEIECAVGSDVAMCLSDGTVVGIGEWLVEPERLERIARGPVIQPRIILIDPETIRSE